MCHLCTDKILAVLQFEVVQKNKKFNLLMLRKADIVLMAIAVLRLQPIIHHPFKIDT